MQQAFGWPRERMVDSRMLYIFAGFPGKQLPPGTPHLHAGGLQHLIETVEKLAMLEHDPVVQYRKEGVFNAITNKLLQPIEPMIGNLLSATEPVPLPVGNHVFGKGGIQNLMTNPVLKSAGSAASSPTHHNNLAGLQIKTAAPGTSRGLDDFSERGNSTLHSSGSFHSSFIPSSGQDRAYEPDYPTFCRISDLCLRDGITWDWFPEGWSCGNGVTIHKTSASPEYKTVVHGTDLDLNQFLTSSGPTRLADLELEREHIITEGWEEYERRWLPGTCPQESHIVHLTCLVTKHPLSDFAYERIKDIIEGAAEPNHLEQYSQEEGRYFSVSRLYDGKPAHGGMA